MPRCLFLCTNRTNIKLCYAGANNLDLELIKRMTFLKYNIIGAAQDYRSCEQCYLWLPSFCAEPFIRISFQFCTVSVNALD